MVGNAYAVGTVRNMKSQWSNYLRFCISNKLQIFPPVIDNVVRFYTHLTQKLSAYSSLQNYQSAITMFYRVYGYDFDTSSVLLKFLNMSAKKSLTTAPATKKPLEIDHLINMLKIANLQNPFHLCFMSAVTLGFFGLLRRSNICPPSPGLFDPTKHLRRQDVSLDQNGVVLKLQWSKTNQHKQSVFEIPIAYSGSKEMDPPSLFGMFSERCPVLPGDPCFSFYHSGTHYILTHKDLSNMLSDFLQAIGVNSEGITTHSIRKGGTCLLHRAGMIPALKEHGTWTSEAYKSYLQYNMSDKLIMTQSVYRFLKLK